jgi:putative ABC transport system permease protein
MNGLAAGLGVVTRFEGASAPFESIRHVVQGRNKQNVVSRPQTMNEVIAASLAQQRFLMILLGAFAGVALLLASLGIYGVISYLVGQRTHELGIRIALGAQRSDVLRLVLNHGLKMALAGVALGIIVSLGVTRLLAKMLFGVSATDPMTFVLITLLLMTVALLACFVPAWRATQVDPLVALRDE